MDITSYLLGKKSSGGGGSGGLDWSAIGYDSTPQAIVDDYNYSKQIYDNWDSTQTSHSFSNDKKLKYMPLVDTSNLTTMRYMFQSCQNLLTIPVLDTSNLQWSTTLESVIKYVSTLTDEGLDNLLQMCINATKYTGTKTFQYVSGQTGGNYPATRIQALPHYNDFINAGWTIGY